MNIRNKEEWAYLNCEAGKDLPFDEAELFKNRIITDPLQVPINIDKASESDKIKGVIVDSLSMLWGQYCTQYVLSMADTQKGWMNYGEFVKSLHQNHAAKSTKTLIFTSHVEEIRNELGDIISSQAVVQGKARSLSIEAYYSMVLSCKVLKIKDLEKELKSYGMEPNENGQWNDLLTVTSLDRRRGIKRVFQTDVTEKTAHEKIRCPEGMFHEDELYIDNDIQIVLDRMDKFYKRT